MSATCIGRATTWTAAISKEGNSMTRRATLVLAALIAFAMLALSLNASAVAVEWPVPNASAGDTAMSAEPLQCPVSTSVEQGSVEESRPGVQVAQRCCKVCKKGKACGNSCINRNYTCRQPPGCACDG